MLAKGAKAPVRRQRGEKAVNNPKHTMFAQKALGLAELFAATFGDKPVGNAVKYRAEMVAPDGPSTGGGKQALQAIKLTPIQGGTTLVAGHANQVEASGELRTYEYLVRWHQQRFKGGELPLEREAYEEFFGRLKTFFAQQQLRVSVTATPTPSGVIPAPAGAPGGRNLPLILGAAVGLVLLGGVLVWVFR